MAFTAVYDADVLYPNTLRDLLVRIAQLPNLVQARWTDQILDEMVRALQKNRPDLRHFPKDRLAPWGVKAKSPDDFVRDQIGIDRQAVWACVQQIVDSRRRRPVTVEDVLGELTRSGLVGTAAALQTT
jgi:hypothetical protein